MLLDDVMAVENVTMGVNYGANKLRFPAPVPVDSRVRAGVELVAITRNPAGCVFEYLVTIEVEGGAKPACVVEMPALIVP